MDHAAANRTRLTHSLMLLVCAFFWGTTFVAQSVAMDQLGPYTYNAARFLLGAAVLLPVAVIAGRRDPYAVNCRPAEGRTPVFTKKRRRKLLLGSGIACGFCIFLAGSFQQVGIQYTTAGKSGFITALYIVLVPVFGLFLRRRCTPLIWASLTLALIGLYLLCIKEGFSIGKGDLITLGSSVMFACHILIVDRLAPRVNGIQLSCLQFLTAGLLSLLPALLLETPSLSAILAAWKPIAYAGILSSGVAYTLQILAQRDMNPTVASLIMSLESCISAIAGWIILGDAMSGKELSGCALMFFAVILAQLPAGRRRAADAASADRTE